MATRKPIFTHARNISWIPSHVMSTQKGSRLETNVPPETRAGREGPEKWFSDFLVSECLYTLKNYWGSQREFIYESSNYICHVRNEDWENFSSFNYIFQKQNNLVKRVVFRQISSISGSVGESWVLPSAPAFSLHCGLKMWVENNPACHGEVSR